MLRRALVLLALIAILPILPVLPVPTTLGLARP
jgi:hypothetical protein